MKKLEVVTAALQVPLLLSRAVAAAAPVNDLCADATVVDVNAPFRAYSNVEATEEGRCGSTNAADRARGVFFQFTGTGNVVAVSTCGSNTQFPTRLSVTEGCPASAGNTAACISNDFPGFDVDCSAGGGRGQTVTFDSTKNTNYRVMVSGDSMGDAGLFDFRVVDYTAPANDNCPSAAPLPLANDATVSRLSGTTIQATKSLTTCLPNSPQRGVWFIFTGNGKPITISTCDSLTNFQNRLYLQDGCSGACISTGDPAFSESCPEFPFGASETFDSVAGKSYRVLVAGQATSQAGPFTISLRSYEPPPNYACDDAIELTVNAAPVLDGTTNAALRTTLDCTGSGGPSRTLRGVYYAFAGTGNVMTVSTCYDKTNFQTFLTVQKGCGTNQCLKSADPGFSVSCDKAFGATFTFDSELGVSYRVMVHGESSTSTGDFAISVVDYPSPANDKCGDAAALQSNRTVTTGSTEFATLDGTCGTPNPGRGVWFIVGGTGTPLRVTTCNGATNFPTALNVTGGCGGDCIPNNDDFSFSCGNPFGQTITFDSTLNTNYRVFVHGKSSSNVGTYGISAEALDRPVNTECSRAISLSLGQVRTGNTEYASIATRCGTQKRRGVWYAIAGTGERIEVNTCRPETDVQFDIQIQTNCGVQCTNIDQDQTFGCPANALATRTSFQSFADFTYLVFVSTSDSSVTGSLGITAKVVVPPPPSAPTVPTPSAPSAPSAPTVPTPSAPSAPSPPTAPSAPNAPSPPTVPAPSGNPPTGTADCNAPCNIIFGFSGTRVHKVIAGRCFSKCTGFHELKLNRLGWKCGPCP